MMRLARRICSRASAAGGASTTTSLMPAGLFRSRSCVGCQSESGALAQGTSTGLRASSGVDIRLHQDDVDMDQGRLRLTHHVANFKRWLLRIWSDNIRVDIGPVCAKPREVHVGRQRRCKVQVPAAASKRRERPVPGTGSRPVARERYMASTRQPDRAVQPNRRPNRTTNKSSCLLFGPIPLLSPKHICPPSIRIPGGAKRRHHCGTCPTLIRLRLATALPPLPLRLS
jgi:hypothetical protein